MGDETIVQNSHDDHTTIGYLQTEEDTFYSEPVCTVILDSSDVTYIQDPSEGGEEIVLYTDVQEVKEEIIYDDVQDIEGEINIGTTTSQEVYTEVHNVPSISNKKNSHKKGSKSGSHKCKLCPKTFSQGINLATHLRIHTGEKPYKCNVCSKPFSQQPNLWKHMRTHTGERPYQCSICKKKFTQQANLTKHIRIHTGERPYCCQYCGKRFTQQANLTKHVRLHTGERPFHCSYCPKTFVQQSNLDRHERTHTGVKPFKCKICYDSFAQNAHLAKHIRTIHKVNDILPVKCEERSTRVEMISKQKVILNNHFDGNSKTFGIPVLYCTKTGKILKRIV